MTAPKMIQYSLYEVHIAHLRYLFGVTKAHWRVLPQLTVPVGAGAVFYFKDNVLQHLLIGFGIYKYRLEIRYKFFQISCFYQELKVVYFWCQD